MDKRVQLLTLLFSAFVFLINLVNSEYAVSRQEEQEELKQGIDNISLLDTLFNSLISLRDTIVAVFQDLLSSLMGSLLSRTETYVGSLQQRLNITHVIESIGFVKVVFISISWYANMLWYGMVWLELDLADCLELDSWFLGCEIFGGWCKFSYKWSQEKPLSH